MKPIFFAPLLLFCLLAKAADFPIPFNTQTTNGNPLPSPEAALKGIQLPPGFKATLFAAEPDVQQPIAMAFDARGRLWVCENYTYAEMPANFDLKMKDRIVIFEDTDGDGRFDQRTVFWDQGQRLTSIELGFGGVFALCPPQLLFIPDRNGDDKPDGEPEVLLDGFDAGSVRHNIANGLKWGPDGWLYGRHGILATSKIAPPGAADAKRVSINCGVWRYHPTRKIVEAVAHGTTNPWGMDWNEYGEAFFINTVIGHLWEVIPGAHYERMYGEDLDPKTYSLIPQAADHFHWDTREKWSDVRAAGVTDTSSKAGGGHAHSGLMIYQGENWPSEYRGSVFTINLHGHRLNRDILERSGSGWVARHGPDFMSFSDPWFRGTDLACGPDGGVFILDWSDIGECHEIDGIHRTSGRIYKVTYGPTSKKPPLHLEKLDPAALALIQSGANEIVSRQARRILQERFARGENVKSALPILRDQFKNGKSIPLKLRALWCLNAIGAADGSWLRDQLRNPDEFIRTWAVRLLVDSGEFSPKLGYDLALLAAKDSSPMVRLALASALQRVSDSEKPALAEGLLKHAEDAKDRNIPLMLWYGVKGLASSDPDSLQFIFAKSDIPLVRRFIARIVTENLEKMTDTMDGLVASSVKKGKVFQSDLLEGMEEGSQGLRQAQQPKSWARLQQAFQTQDDSPAKERLEKLSILFGDRQTLEKLNRVARDASAPVAQRRRALGILTDSRAEELRPTCEQLLLDPVVGDLAARGLKFFEDAAIATQLTSAFGKASPEARKAILDTLVSRATFANVLLDKMVVGQVPREAVTPFHARQIRSLNQPQLNQKLAERWGQVRDGNEEKKNFIIRLRSQLGPETLKKADLSRGHQLFVQACSVCHTLNGEGAKIGPDLTGSGRDNLDYLLENIVDPSGIVAVDFRISVVSFTDDRVVNGVVTPAGEKTMAIQTMTERLVVPKEEIRSIEKSNLSLMPEGLLESLEKDQVRDLVAYLMKK